MKTLIFLLSALLACANEVPPCCVTNPPPESNPAFTGKPPTRIVRHGVHVLFDWDKATNKFVPQPPVVSVVLTNNQAEWSTNMIGNTNIWANDVSIYRYGWWVVKIWWDINATNREVQFSEFPYVTNSWSSLGTVSSTNPREPYWLQTFIYPPFPPPDNRGFFRLKRKDLGLH